MFCIVTNELNSNALSGSISRRRQHTEKPRFAETWLLNETVNSPRSTFSKAFICLGKCGSYVIANERSPYVYRHMLATWVVPRDLCFPSHILGGIFVFGNKLTYIV